MISQDELNKKLADLNIKLSRWGKSELIELAKILTPSEELSQVVNGYYENGFALLASTDHRILLIDKKPLNFLNVEDFRFDMINQLDYNHRLWKSTINISAGSKNLQFTSYNQKGLRELLNSVQCRMIEIKQEQKDNVQLQRDKLDMLEQTLRQYAQVQLDQSKPPLLSSLGLNLGENQTQPVSQALSPSGIANVDEYLKRIEEDSESKRYIKTGSLLPRPDLQAAKIVFAKLPSVAYSRRRHHAAAHR